MILEVINLEVKLVEVSRSPNYLHQKFYFY